MKDEVFEGKSEAEALLKASEALGVNISDMEYEVIENESGLFGLFGKSVKVRVHVPEGASKIVYRNNQTSDDADTDEPGEHAGNVEEPETTGGKASDAAAALQGILDRMDVEASVTADEDDQAVFLDIETRDEEAVIGRDGEVLQALQFVVNKMVNRFPGDRKRVILDVAGYRDRRAGAIRSMARDLGEKAARTGKVVRLSPMNPQDRRLVHLALKDQEGVSTRSEGEGMFRCVLIVPDGFRGRRGGRGGREGGSRGPRRQRDRAG